MRPRGLFYERLDLLWTAYYIALALLGVRLLYVQVIRNVYYSRVAERNRTQVIYQTAPRGRIYDRNGKVLATNQPAFSLIYLPGKRNDPALMEEFAGDLSSELGLDKAQLLETLREAEREESAMHLAENLPPKTMFKLSEIKTVYPGVDLIVEARRHYPGGGMAAHLLGYMGKMDKKSWRKLKERGYRADSRIGKAGLERLFERELRGVDGEVRMEVDAQGRLKRILDRVPWKPGGNVFLALDARLQETAEKALKATKTGRGAAVVLDPRTGEILALASVPTFDPNLFLLPEKDPARAQVRDIPEFNLAASGTYSPGSIFKIVVAAAMLEKGRISPAERVFCPGHFWVGRRMFRCWEKEGHRYQDWVGALTHSCDVYYYQMGIRTGGAAIEEFEKMFRLGQKTGIALHGEKPGNRFGPEARRARGKAWYEGDTANLSIGQGELLVTPVQMAVMAAAAGNRGILWRPHFTKKIEYRDGRSLSRQKSEIAGKVELKPETWDMVHKAMVSVVRNGTGRSVNIPGLVVAGKTGTVQNPHGDDHAWFVSYAGLENEAPSIALSVLVQHGGHGSSSAGPVARAILMTAFADRLPRRPAPAAAVPPEAADVD